MLDKTSLRRRLRQARLDMPDSEVSFQSTRVVTQLKRLIEETQPESVHCFEPIMELHEVDVLSLIKYLQMSRSQGRLYTSRYIGEGWRVVTLSSNIVAERAYYDMVIVPMLGFDLRLHRLGYGGGYYDRLLSEQPRALKVGVCFELGRVSNLPSEAHDIPLDIIVTEANVYRRQRN